MPVLETTPLRFGVFLQQRVAGNGGAFTFQNSILEGLRACPTTHELWLLHDEELTPPRLAEMGFRAASLREDDARHAPALSPPPVYHPRRIGRGLQRRLKALLGVPPAQAEPAHAQAARRAERLRQCADRLALDLIWYPDPGSPNIDIERPFFVTVWDLEHRKQPYFPEVSVTGWTWDAREAHYARVLPRAAAVFSGTEEGREELIRFYRLDPARVLVNPFPAPAPATGPDEQTSAQALDRMSITRPFLVYPAQFWPHKNHVSLLHALQLLKAYHGLEPDLVLTGSDVGNRAHVEAAAEELGLRHRVHFAGFVPTDDLQVLYRKAEALVFPSMFGPDNLPPLEAFAAGCPVVAADIAGAAQHLAGAALLFDPLDPIDIAAKTAAVLADTEVRRGLMDAGFKVASERTAQRHVATAFSALDRFAALRRNWGREYRHT